MIDLVLDRSLSAFGSEDGDVLAPVRELEGKATPPVPDLAWTGDGLELAYDPSEPRDDHGRWTTGPGGGRKQPESESDTDYRMQHRPSDDGPRIFDLTEGDKIVDAESIYQHPDWYTSAFDADTRRALAETTVKLNSVRGHPDKLLMIYRSSPKRTQIRSGDWVALSRTYARNEGRHPTDPKQDMPVHAKLVKARDVRWAMDDLMEYGYFPELSHVDPTLEASVGGVETAYDPSEARDYHGRWTTGPGGGRNRKQPTVPVDLSDASKVREVIAASRYASRLHDSGMYERESWGPDNKPVLGRGWLLPDGSLFDLRNEDHGQVAAMLPRLRLKSDKGDWFAVGQELERGGWIRATDDSGQAHEIPIPAHGKVFNSVERRAMRYAQSSFAVSDRLYLDFVNPALSGGSQYIWQPVVSPRELKDAGGDLRSVLRAKARSERPDKLVPEEVRHLMAGFSDNNPRRVRIQTAHSDSLPSLTEALAPTREDAKRYSVETPGYYSMHDPASAHPEIGQHLRSRGVEVDFGDMDANTARGIDAVLSRLSDKYGGHTLERVDTRELVDEPPSTYARTEGGRISFDAGKVKRPGALQRAGEIGYQSGQLASSGVEGYATHEFAHTILFSRGYGGIAALHLDDIRDKLGLSDYQKYKRALGKISDYAKTGGPEEAAAEAFASAALYRDEATPLARAIHDRMVELLHERRAGHGGVERAYSPAQPRDFHGRWTMGRPAPGPLAVTVKDDPAFYGDEYAGSHLRQPSGSPVRGTPMPPDDPRIPAEVYHVSPFAEEIKHDGVIRAGGAGGLGGDKHDRMVSFTIDHGVAVGLQRDMSMVAQLARDHGDAPPIEWSDSQRKWLGTEARSKWGEGYVASLSQKAASEGWKFTTRSGSVETYGPSDWLNIYFIARESKTGARNPIFMGYDQAHWQAIDPRKVGIVTVPKASLKTGAMVTNFDLGQHSLEEIRVYGDVPLDPARIRKAADGSSVVEFAYNPSEPRDDHGRWTSGKGVAALDAIPVSEIMREPGTRPIPSGTLRLYHFTRPVEGRKGEIRERLASINEHGIQASHAKGETYGEPNMIWASTQQPDRMNHLFVEFAVKPEQIDIGAPDAWRRSPSDLAKWQAGNHDVTIHGDIPRSQIVAVHEPWHETYRQIAKTPAYREFIRNGEISESSARDMDDEQTAIAVRRWLAEHPEDRPREQAYSPNEPRDYHGRWTSGMGGYTLTPEQTSRVEAWLTKRGADPHGFGDRLDALYARTDGEMQAAKEWYANAHRSVDELAAKHEVPARRVAGVVAAMSPQTEWTQNLQCADLLLSKVARKPKVTAGELTGLLGSQTRMNIDMALKMARGADPASTLTGAKRRSFYANMLAPNYYGPVTIDGHMARVMMPMLTKSQVDHAIGHVTVKGGNKLADVYSYAGDVIRERANAHGILPQQYQAAVWLVYNREIRPVMAPAFAPGAKTWQ